ncbi:MAG TPA: response regulator [Candidatus Binatia bacterium]|nr:response regulator [Candidatus Binatia bacterium]
MQPRLREAERASTPILLAEDDPVLRRLVGDTLRGEGHEVVEAADGVELLERLEAAMAAGQRGNAPISLVVTDVRMPGLSGLDVLSILRCGHWTTPVILLTAFPEPDVRLAAEELAATAVLEKPVDLEALRAAVRRALGSSGPRAGRTPSDRVTAPRSVRRRDEAERSR